MLVRPEEPSDHAAVAALLARAFADPAAAEPPEVGLVAALRGGSSWIAELALVADAPDEAILGYVVCTRGAVGDRPALALGPLAVAPDAQRRGVGSALMDAVLRVADARGEPLVALLGDPGYYGRFGFVAAAGLAIDAPDPAWGRHFQVRKLNAYEPTLTGPFRYPPEFGVG